MTGQIDQTAGLSHRQIGIRANLASRHQLRAFNEASGIAVHFDTLRAAAPQIEIIGSQSTVLSVWTTRSTSGFVTHPQFTVDMISLRFVIGGQIVYRCRADEYLGLPDVATLVAFDELRQVEASTDFSAVSATLSLRALSAAQSALTGGESAIVPLFEPSARMSDGRMRALLCTLMQIQKRMPGADHLQDYMFPLLHEILSYQLLTAWPKRAAAPEVTPGRLPPRYLRRVLDYIDAHLARPMTLAEIAAVAGVSVRAVQSTFKDALGQSPTQFIIEQRLIRTHRDFADRRNADKPISEIAKRWGFVHMSDFGQRYRRAFGCTPRDTRQRAAGPLHAADDRSVN